MRGLAQPLRVALIGYKFMGKAHSHAYRDVAMFFDVPQPQMKVIVGRNAEGVRAAAAKYGWEESATDWRAVVERPDIDVVDIVTPNNSHAEIAIAALKAGKHVLCEKPLAMNLTEAKAMLAAARASGKVAMVCHNYRYAPAVQLAKQLIASGRLGRILHVRAQYLQDWIMDPNFPAVWRLQKDVTGSGALGDIGAHILDLARFLVGEITAVCGLLKTFVTERPVDTSGEGAWGATGSAAQKVKVDVDDAAAFLAHFENGAVGVFEATRFAGGNKNRNRFEINGEKGSIRWDLEDMNWLEVWFADDPSGLQGFRRISVTEAVHPYAGAYWPPGHIIGYEHTFLNLLAEFLRGIQSGTQPAPSFLDGARNQAVLEAVERSHAEGRWVEVERVE